VKPPRRSGAARRSLDIDHHPLDPPFEGSSLIKMVALKDGVHQEIVSQLPVGIWDSGIFGGTHESISSWRNKPFRSKQSVSRALAR
jgi:hypothetical protein